MPLTGKVVGAVIWADTRDLASNARAATGM